MKALTYLAVLAPLALSACGIPDIIAHGVKAYEKSQDQKDQSTEAQTVPSAPIQVQPQVQPEPPPVAPPPPRQSVIKEKL